MTEGGERDGDPSLGAHAPGPATGLDPNAAEREVRVAPDVEARVNGRVAAFVDDVMASHPDDDEYRGRVTDIAAIGAREIAATSQMTRRFLDQPMHGLRGSLGARSPLAKDLAELRRIFDDLDPARYDLDEPGPRRMLGVIPAGNRLRAYLDRYARAQERIDELIGSLEEGNRGLRQENAAIDQEQRSLRMQIESLRQYAFMTERLDETLEARIAALDEIDPERATALREEVLFPVRVRRRDILTQLAVASQGEAALGIVKQTNDDLIGAVRVATSTTVAAARTAALVAQAIANRRAVEEQIDAVNDALGGMVEDGIPGLDVDALQRSWTSVFAALDQVDTSRRRVLASMPAAVLAADAPD